MELSTDVMLIRVACLSAVFSLTAHLFCIIRSIIWRNGPALTEERD